MTVVLYGLHTFPIYKKKGLYIIFARKPKKVVFEVKWVVFHPMSSLKHHSIRFDCQHWTFLYTSNTTFFGFRAKIMYRPFFIYWKGMKSIWYFRHQWHVNWQRCLNASLMSRYMCYIASNIGLTDLNFNFKIKCVKKCTKEIKLLMIVGELRKKIQVWAKLF